MHDVILVAPAAFKGSLGPRQVAEAISMGARRALPGATVLQCPISDGGDGLLDAVLPPGSLREHLKVTGPLGDPVSGELGWVDPETAMFESATACGIALLQPDQLDPLRATPRVVARSGSSWFGKRSSAAPGPWWWDWAGLPPWTAARVRPGGWVGRCATPPGPLFLRAGARWSSSRYWTGAGGSKRAWWRWRM